MNINADLLKNAAKMMGNMAGNANQISSFLIDPLLEDINNLDEDQKKEIEQKLNAEGKSLSDIQKNKDELNKKLAKIKNTNI